MVETAREEERQGDDRYPIGNSDKQQPASGGRGELASSQAASLGSFQTR